MATTASKADKTPLAKQPNPSGNETSEEISAMLLPSLYRLTEGLPRKELKMMISESMICEEALENEIRELQEALESSKKSDAEKKPSVELMLESEVTPPDRFFTVSALLGRLRDDLATPLPPNSTLPALRAQVGLAPPPPKKKKKESNMASSTTETPAASGAVTTAQSGPPSTTLEKQKKVLSLYQLPQYTEEHAEPTALLALWKKISSHRSSIVFRRPVNPKEAPGYTERIAFPMDLSLIRKMIVARQIKSYSDLHQRLGLICHNCVKYNGRESDYGIVTRDFESNADEMVVAAVFTATHEARNPRPKSATPPPATIAAPAPQTAGTEKKPPAPATASKTVSSDASSSQTAVEKAPTAAAANATPTTASVGESKEEKSDEVATSVTS